MALSSDLISQFVQLVNNKKENKETTVYGTAVKVGDKTYVRLDGSELLTPVSTTTEINDAEKVTVLIKNHTAIVTGNISSPSVGTSTLKSLDTKITDVESLVAGSISADQLAAESARIDKLVAENVLIKKELDANEASIETLTSDNITINEKLTAAEADITNLETTKLDADIASVTYATIENLEATNVKVNNLDATYGDFHDLTTKRLDAAEADIDNLEANKLDASTAKITYATIERLNATKADVDVLGADVAEIDTLIFGVASGDTIQTSFADAVIAQLGDAQIKSAMIESITADKITSGDVITNNVRVLSEDGKLLISDETIQISDNTRVRVQIGKDSTGDYSISIWDSDGNLMFSEGGITDNAIKNAIIRDDMVSDTADISAHKLNVDTLFEVINGSTNTIKSTQVYLDTEKQTLDVAFKSLSTEVTDLGETVASQGTEISAIQGAIASRIWESEINTASDEMNTQYSELEQRVDNISATVASHSTQIANKADSSTVTNVESKVTEIESSLSGFQTSVSSTYATKSEVENIEIGVRNLLRNSKGDDFTDWAHAGASIVEDSIKGKCGERTNDTTSKENYFGSTRTPIIEQSTQYTFSADLWCNEYLKSYDLFWLSDTEAEQKTVAGYVNILSNPNRTLTANTWQRVSWTFTTHVNDHTGYIRIDNNGTTEEGTAAILRVANLKLEKGNRATDWTPAPEDLEDRVTTAETKIIQNESSITTLANRTTTVENKFAGYSTTEQMNSAIKQSADGITSSVSETYTTKTEFNNLELGGRNLVAGTDDTTEYVKNVTDGAGTYYDVWTGRTISIPTETQYVVSFDAKADVAQDITCYFYNPNTTTGSLSSTGQTSSGTDGAAKVSITTEWARYWVKWTQTVPETVKSIIVGRNFTENDVYIRAVKFEAGNKATAWTPAPEDMATAKDAETAQSTANTAQETASNAQTLVRQLSDNISMLVTDGNGTSLMTQTDEGWTFSTAEIQTMVNTTSEGLSDLSTELGDTNNTVEVLKQAVNDLGEIAEYVSIGTYEDEPCIELGEADSDFKLFITNTRILFMEGSSIVAHITNQSLHIKKAVVEEELQQGGFVWQVRSNGNLGLVWKGVSS